jgi:uncharacterized protein
MSERATDDGEALARESAFSYQCRACSRCCRHKTIQVNPYELARLAVALDCSVETLIAGYTDGGTRLRQLLDGRCVFLGDQGCTVHAHRPLVCRLYPLGRIVNTGGERFIELQPHPQSAGLYGGNGTVGDYLHAQQAQAFMDAADHYFRLYLELADAVGLQDAEEAAEDLSANLLDLPAAVGQTNAHEGQLAPVTLEAMVPLHVDAIRNLLSSPE